MFLDLVISGCGSIMIFLCTIYKISNLWSNERFMNLRALKCKQNSGSKEGGAKMVKIARDDAQ